MTAGIGGYATYQTPSRGISSVSHDGASVRWMRPSRKALARRTK